MSKHLENKQHQMETMSAIEVSKQDLQALSDDLLETVTGGKTLAELFREEDWQPVPGARMNEYGRKPLHVMSSIPEEAPKRSGVLGTLGKIFRRP